MVMQVWAPDFSGARKTARIRTNVKNLEAIFSSLQTYAHDLEGRQPSSLNELIEKGYLDHEQTKDQFSPNRENGFTLVAARPTFVDSEDTVLVVQTFHYVGNPVFVLKDDGSVLVLDLNSAGLAAC